MRYLIIGLLIGVYLLLNTVVIGLGFIGSYAIRPLLWLSLGAVAFLIAKKEGRNIIKFKRMRRWYLGNSPLQAGLLLGGFQVSILIIVGIFAGFGESPYSFTPLFVMINIFYIGSFLIGTEFSRSYLVNKGSISRKYLTVNLLIGTILYMFIRLRPGEFLVLNFNAPVAALEFLGAVLITALSMNLLASYLSYLGGATAAMSYVGTLMAFEWFSPILPATHWTIIALVGTISPAIGFVVIQNSIMTNESKKIGRRTRRKIKSESGSWTVIAIFSLILIFFSFGYLGVTPTVIYTGSMSPELQVGDLVILTEADFNELQEGDIIQYLSYDNVTLVVHRIVEIQRGGDQTLYITKGDANEIPDIRPITENRIIGKSIFTVPKIGWVQIIVRNVFSRIGV